MNRLPVPVAARVPVPACSRTDREKQAERKKKRNRMSSSREFVEYVKEQLSTRPDVIIRPMMGEYLVYWGGRLGGDICDNRLLVKPVPAGLELLPKAAMEPPYPGAKSMVLVENLEDRAFLRRLMEAMEPELPLPKKRKPKKKAVQ